MTALPLAGCLDQVGDAFRVALGDEEGAAPITRVVEAHIDDDLEPDTASPEAALASVLDVAFEYRHSGAPVEAADVDASYTDDAGLVRERSLSAFHDGTLSAGDVVTIDGVALTSGLVLRHGGEVLAERQGVERDWFTADGYPLPLAATEDGALEWTVTGSGGFDVAGSDVAVSGTEEVCSYDPETFRETCEEEQTSASFDRLDVSLSESLDGTVTASLAPDGEGKRLRFAADLTASSQADVDVQGTVGGETGAFVGGGSVDADVDGLVDLFFDRRGALTAVAGQGSASVTADYEATITSEGETETVDESAFPDVDESFPYTREELDLDGSAEPTVVAFLESLWRLDLAVGDRFHLSVTAEDGLDTYGLDYTLQVTDATERGGVPTLRVQETAETTGGTGLQALTEERVEFTYWVHEQTYQPVFAQFGLDKRLDRADLQEILGDVQARAEEEGASFEATLPEGAFVHYRAEGSVELTQAGTDLAVPGLLAFQGIRLSVVPAAMVFVLVSDLGGEESPPEIAFLKDDGSLTVIKVSADGPVSWGDLDVSGCEVVPSPFEDVFAGDELSGCGGTVTVVHWPTNTLVYQTDLS